MNPAMREGVLTVTVKNVVPLPKGVESPFVKVIAFTTNPRAFRAPSLPRGSPRRGPSPAIPVRPPAGRAAPVTGGDPLRVSRCAWAPCILRSSRRASRKNLRTRTSGAGALLPYRKTRAPRCTCTHTHTLTAGAAPPLMCALECRMTRLHLLGDQAQLHLELRDWRRPLSSAALGELALPLSSIVSSELDGCEQTASHLLLDVSDPARGPERAPHRRPLRIDLSIRSPRNPEPTAARARLRPPAPARARPCPHARPARAPRSFDLREERVPRLARHLHPDRGALAACPACRRAVYLPRPTPLHAHPALREAAKAKPRYLPWLRDYSALHNVGPRPLASPRPQPGARAACYPARCGSLTNKRGVASHVIARGHCSAAPAR